jgi:hypothetical protein
MKTQLITLAAGLLLSTASATAANATPASDQWVADASVALQARVADAGLADDGKAVVIRIKAVRDYKDYAPSVKESSGSADYDQAVRNALKGVRLPAPPNELSGRAVAFTLGQPVAGASVAAN